MPSSSCGAHCMLLFVKVAETLLELQTLYLDNCESMLIVFINIPFYTNRICDEFIVRLCEAASSAVWFLLLFWAECPHIPSRG